MGSLPWFRWRLAGLEPGVFTKASSPCPRCGEEIEEIKPGPSCSAGEGSLPLGRLPWFGWRVAGLEPGVFTKASSPPPGCGKEIEEVKPDPLLDEEPADDPSDEEPPADGDEEECECIMVKRWAPSLLFLFRAASRREFESPRRACVAEQEDAPSIGHR